jgi:3-hydroxybutyryl-CoA dehydrogenase
MNLRTIGVAGAGTMGSGIVEVAAVAGFDVLVVDVATAQLDRGRAIIRASLDKAVRRGKLPAGDRDIALARVRFGTSLNELADCDFVIEAIVEDAAAKTTLHAELGPRLRPDVVQATNTSSISVTQLGRASGRPDRFIGMHFFNPVPVMPLVEVVVSSETSDASLATTESLARRMNKTPLRVRDAPGFVANRVLMPMINEAAFALAAGVADAPTIDQIMVLGCHHPMGPLALADLIGLDVCLFILEVLERDTGDAKFRPCPLLRAMVASGQLGRKSGRGFFDYGPAGAA